MQLGPCASDPALAEVAADGPETPLQDQETLHISVLGMLQCCKVGAGLGGLWAGVWAMGATKVVGGDGMGVGPLVGSGKMLRMWVRQDTSRQC